MASRGADYAAQYAVVNDELIAAIEGWPDERWRQPSAGEGWPVGVVAHHVAETAGAFAGMLGRFAAGETYTPDISMERIHQWNADHAASHAEIGKADVLAALRTQGDAVMAALHALDDARFDQPAGVYGGNPLAVSQVVEYVVLGHAREHLASILATR